MIITILSAFVRFWVKHTSPLFSDNALFMDDPFLGLQQVSAWGTKMECHLFIWAVVVKNLSQQIH